MIILRGILSKGVTCFCHASCKPMCILFNKEKPGTGIFNPQHRADSFKIECDMRNIKKSSSSMISILECSLLRSMTSLMYVSRKTFCRYLDFSSCLFFCKTKGIPSVYYKFAPRKTFFIGESRKNSSYVSGVIYISSLLSFKAVDTSEESIFELLPVT